MEIEKVKEGLHICTTEGSDCTRCSYHEYGYPYSCHFRLTKDAFTAMEELMAQVKNKDYLIQQQADEIERLRQDVKKQQEKMFKLAKRLPHWVSVEERLPNSQELVIVGITDTAGDTPFSYASCGWLTPDKGCWIVDNDVCDFVVAWMPLPEPPQEVQDGKKRYILDCYILLYRVGGLQRPYIFHVGKDERRIARIKAEQGGAGMSKICKNYPCNQQQGTAGCVSAEWCPYFIADAPVRTTDKTEMLPMDKWPISNKTEVQK